MGSDRKKLFGTVNELSGKKKWNMCWRETTELCDYAPRTLSIQAPCWQSRTRFITHPLPSSSCSQRNRNVNCHKKIRQHFYFFVSSLLLKLARKCKYELSLCGWMYTQWWHNRKCWSENLILFPSFHQVPDVPLKVLIDPLFYRG